MKLLSFYFLFSQLLFVNSYLTVPSIKRYTRDINGTPIKVYEPKNINKKETHSIIFFTGGNAIITSEVYTNFLSKLASQGLSIFISPSDLEKTDDLFETISEEYLDVTNVGHSSGAVVAIKTANQNKQITKSILLDPVDSDQLFNSFTFPTLPFIENNNLKPLKFKYIKDLLIINAKKSYEWKVFPPTIPFVPAFKMETDKITKDNVNVNLIEAENFGHSDILNPMWSDIMHKTISKGSDDRDETILDEYHDWLANTISTFIYNSQDPSIINLDENQLPPSDYENENIEFI